MARNNPGRSTRRLPSSSEMKQQTLTQIIQFSRQTPPSSRHFHTGLLEEEDDVRERTDRLKGQQQQQPRSAKRRRLHEPSIEPLKLSVAALKAIWSRSRADQECHRLPSPPLSTEPTNPSQKSCRFVTAVPSKKRARNSNEEILSPQLSPQTHSFPKKLKRQDQDRSPLKDLSVNLFDLVSSPSSTPEKQSRLEHIYPTAFSRTESKGADTTKSHHQIKKSLITCSQELRQSQLLISSKPRKRSPDPGTLHDQTAMKTESPEQDLSHLGTEQNAAGIQAPLEPHVFRKPPVPVIPLPKSIHARKYIAPYIKRKEARPFCETSTCNRSYRVAEVDRSFGDDMLQWTQDSPTRRSAVMRQISNKIRRSPRRNTAFQIYQDHTPSTLPPFEVSGSQTEAEDQLSQQSSNSQVAEDVLNYSTPTRRKALRRSLDLSRDCVEDISVQDPDSLAFISESSPSQIPGWTQADWKWQTASTAIESLPVISSKAICLPHSLPSSDTEATPRCPGLKHLSSMFMSSTQDLDEGPDGELNQVITAAMMESVVEVSRPPTPEAKRKVYMEILSSSPPVREIPESPNNCS